MNFDKDHVSVSPKSQARNQLYILCTKEFGTRAHKTKTNPLVSICSLFDLFHVFIHSLTKGNRSAGLTQTLH